MTSQKPHSDSSKIGLGGPDYLSPKSEIESEIARLEALKPLPSIKVRLAELQTMLLTATESGGFQTSP